MKNARVLSLTTQQTWSSYDSTTECGLDSCGLSQEWQDSSITSYKRKVPIRNNTLVS